MPSERLEMDDFFNIGRLAHQGGENTNSSAVSIRKPLDAALNANDTVATIDAYLAMADCYFQVGL